ncbi:GNAT family N-acetyltransferase [Paraburkholderia diazotrophica]|uniref:GNAT family N-acetyltransferase n=1 Tax=Paraburkholderia diazotrophica TaxID=667676 RepID=UPI00316BF8A9
MIIIEIDDEGNRAVASHRAESVGWIEFEHCSNLSTKAPVTLLDVYVVPGYRRNGIAHTLIAYVSSEMGGPIQIGVPTRSVNADFDRLCSNLMHEGLLVR